MGIEVVGGCVVGELKTLTAKGRLTDCNKTGRRREKCSCAVVRKKNLRMFEQILLCKRHPAFPLSLPPSSMNAKAAFTLAQPTSGGPVRRQLEATIFTSATADSAGQGCQKSMLLAPKTLCTEESE